MAKKVAVIAVNPVNGYGLFQYLETFFENGIPYKVYAVAETKDIKTNSGLEIQVDDIIANLKNKADEYDALVFACGDAIPQYAENASAQYNQDMLEVISLFNEKEKILSGHCAAGLLFEFAGITDGKKITIHPFVKDAITKGIASGNLSESDGNLFTAQTEHAITEMLPKLLKVLKD